MNLKKRYFERAGVDGAGTAVVETPIAPFEGYEDSVDRSVTLADLDFSVSEARRGFEETVGSAKHFDVMAAIQYLETMANSAIKKADVIVAQLEDEKDRAASAAVADSGEIDIPVALEVLRTFDRACPKCGGIRATEIAEVKQREPSSSP